MDQPLVIEDNLDKECNALGGLFQQIVNEMKVGIPNFEELAAKAGKLNSSLKSTILILGSFLDTFQKIADAASNTKGSTRDIGTCLTRIVIRHRALESRMKTLSGALMDCLVLPIQSKLEEWKKITHVLDKEHARDYKKYRSHIKKKSEAVLRLRKKARKDSCSSNGTGLHITDPSVQRLMEQTSRDLNIQYRQFFDQEKKCLRKILTEERHRYCNLVASLKPVIDEEMGMLSELASIEDVMQKLGRVTTNPDLLPEAADQVIDDAAQHGSSMCFATPPSTPSPSMGSRKSSMCSIASEAASTSTNGLPMSPSRSSVTSMDTTSSSSVTRHRSFNQHDFASLRRNLVAGAGSAYNGCDMSSAASDSRPNSALSSTSFVPTTSSNGWSCEGQRPHTISASFERNGAHQRPMLNGQTFIPEKQLPNSEPVSPSKAINGLSEMQTYSTIKRSYRSPFRTSMSSGVASRPPLPSRCSSADRSSGGSSLQRSTSVERSNSAFGKPPIVPPPSGSNSVHVIGFHNNNEMTKAAKSNSDKNSNVVIVSPMHYATPKAATKIQLVPDFHQGKHDMVIPQPVYMNAEEMEKMRKIRETEPGGLGLVRSESRCSQISSKNMDDCISEDDLKTPTVEELAFPGQKMPEDASSSSSSGSSGYGSQSAIKLDEPPLMISEGFSSRIVDSNNSSLNNNYTKHFYTIHNSTSTTLDRPRRLYDSPIVENIISNSTRPDTNHHRFNFNRTSLNIYNNTARRAPSNSYTATLRRSDSYSPGMSSVSTNGRTSFVRSISANSGRPPPPPIRRSSSISSQDDCSRPHSFKPPLTEEDDITPHGSVENVSIASPPPGEDRLSLEAMVAKASCVASNLANFEGGQNKTSSSEDLNFPPPPPPQMSSSFMDRDQFLRRSLTLTSRADRVNLINSLTERISQRMSQQQQNNKLVIAVNGAIPSASTAPEVNKQLRSADVKVSKQPKSAASPEGEIYGFGMQFRESSKQYFDMSASYPTSETVENQKFLDALSSKLLGKPIESKSRLNAEIQSGSFNLRKTNGIVNDKSAPRF